VGIFIWIDFVMLDELLNQYYYAAKSEPNCVGAGRRYPQIFWQMMGD
jgi:hypothetical protein